MIKPEIVTLLPTDDKWCDELGRDRYKNSLRKNAPGRNNAPSRGPVALQMTLDGGFGELSFYLFARPCLWIAFEWENSHRAEFEDFVDVKHRKLPWHDLPIPLERNGGHPDRAYIAVYAHNAPAYEIDGWCFGREAMLKKYLVEWEPNRPCFAVKRGDPILKPPLELVEEMRRRQYDKYGADFLATKWIDIIDERLDARVAFSGRHSSQSR